mmetsp:Transcript_27900/g.78876  ORF Transcript_27900/g.78876 Transcript_27900/m.78876 type:complete len:152 (+) Transcript_27900:1097-1552(+)
MENRGWWMTMMLDSPRLHRCLRPSSTVREAVASRPEVGSSRKRTLGWATSSMPMLTRFLWPPLIPRFSTLPTTEFMTSVSCSSSAVPSTICLRSRLECDLGSRTCAAKERFSCTVRSSCTVSSCGTKPLIDLITLRGAWWLLISTSPHCLP